MSEFDQRRENSTYWGNKANDLYIASEVLWKCIIVGPGEEIKTKLGMEGSGRLDVALPSVFRMLCGMAMELLLKTIIVAKGGEPKATHHLDELAVEAGVIFTPQQVGLLKILSRSVIWGGKYPIPKREQEWNELVNLERELLFKRGSLGDTGLTVYSRNDALEWESFNELWIVAFEVMVEVVNWLTFD